MIVHAVTGLVVRTLCAAVIDAALEHRLTPELRGHALDFAEWLAFRDQEWHPSESPDLWTRVDSALMWLVADSA